MNEDAPREPDLFDLPLDGPPPAAPESDREPTGAPRRAAASEPARTLPLFEAESEPAAAAGSDSRREAALRGRPVAVPSPPSEPRTASPVRRLIGTVGDLLILAAVGALASAGAAGLGVTPASGRLPALLLFVVVFSFLYSVVPLAFWGSTPGMSWARLVARNGAREPLSFGQTALRWLATWATWASLGLLGLVALSGRSLADRLSGSRTFEVLSSEPV